MTTLKAPLTISLLVVSLLSSGIYAGFIIAQKMEQSRLEHRRQQRIAAEIAALGPPKPERVPFIEERENPFKPRYVEFGEELTSNFKEPKRVLIVSIVLMTQRGERAFALLQDKKIPLRALSLANLSEFPLSTAITPEGSQILANTLKSALNADIRAKTGFSPIDAVLITSYFVQ